MANTYAALRTAIRHIEHMAAWIAERKAGYSFESLGEDMPGIREALSKLQQTPAAWIEFAENGNVQFWTDDTQRAAREIIAGRKLHMFTLADLVILVAKSNRAAARKAEAHLLPDASPGNGADDWRDDPSADERWNAGLDFGMMQFCAALGVDPKGVRWDAATETLDGDVNAVICNILRVKFGDDFDGTAPVNVGAEKALRKLEALAEKQKSYWETRQREFPGIEDYIDIDGNLNLPDEISPLLHGENTNGRYSEADWWLSTIRAALHSTSSAGETRPTMPRGGVEPDWHAESVKLYRQNKALRTALQEQHDWHLAQGGKDFGDGITLYMADEYSDSGMCERTTSILSEVLPSGIQGYEAWKAKVSPSEAGAAGETTSSDGGVESETRKEPSARAQSLIADGRDGLGRAHASVQAGLGVAPGPSEAIPADERDPYGEAEQWGMQYALGLFGKQIAGIETWEGGDGSESVDGDVIAEFHNIAKAAGWVNADGDAAFGPSGTTILNEAEIRAGLNILLETIAAKFETWNTLDIWRSEAASTVRSYKRSTQGGPTAKDTDRPTCKPDGSCCDFICGN